jgi:4-hydroxybenzoate polyprenyltransferase
VFALAAGMLNRFTLALAPVALFVICGYSYTKRFTAFCHFALGLSLAMAPVGAWLGIRGAFDPLPLFLALGVTFWTAGFDILYACQDVEYDRKRGLRSIPASLGVEQALRVAALLHGLCIAAFALPIVFCGYGVPYGAGLGVIAVLLAWEHRIVKADDLARVNRAFFHVNAVVSVGLMAALLADLYSRR